MHSGDAYYCSIKEHGFNNMEIVANTGHKNAASIDRYNRKRRDSDFYSMSTTLSIEASSKKVFIKRIGSHGKVTAMEDQNGHVGETSEMSRRIEFSGNFKDCHFIIGKK